MTIIFFKKKNLLRLCSFTLIIFSLFISSIFLKKIKLSNQTINPIIISKSDIAIKDNSVYQEIVLFTKSNHIDCNVTCNNTKYTLSDYIKDNVLFTKNTFLKPVLILHDLSRDKIPELILQGYKFNKPITYIFSYKNNSIKLLYTCDKNIFGIFNSNNTRTPEIFFIDSKKGISYSDSYMNINNTFINTQNNVSNDNCFDALFSFISLVESKYEPDDLPDIFTSNIDSSDLVILWSLKKDLYSYDFQDAFFYDIDWNNNSNPMSINFRLSFKKTTINSSNLKSEFIVLLNFIKEDNVFKISSIEIS